MLASSCALFPSFWCTAALSSLRHAALIFRACVWSPSLLSLPLSLHLLLPPSKTCTLFYLPYYLKSSNNFFLKQKPTLSKTHILSGKKRKTVTNSLRCSDLHSASRCQSPLRSPLLRSDHLHLQCWLCCCSSYCWRQGVALAARPHLSSLPWRILNIRRIRRQHVHIVCLKGLCWLEWP